MVGLDAERDDIAVRGGGSRFLAELDEAFGVAHDMIGGEHDDDGLRRAARGDARGDGDRGGRIAPRGLEDDIGRSADGAQLIGDEEAIIGVGDDDRLVEGLVRQRLNGGLEGRQLADERNELFRESFPRFGPYARARPAAHYDR